MAHDGKKRFSVCRGARTQGQKDTLFLKWMTHKLVNWCVFNMYVLDPCCFCRIWALRVSCFTCTKSNPFLLFLVKSFKYDKWKPILNSEYYKCSDMANCSWTYSMAIKKALTRRLRSHLLCDACCSWTSSVDELFLERIY